VYILRVRATAGVQQVEEDTAFQVG
jgi:hypothetical protein